MKSAKKIQKAHDTKELKEGIDLIGLPREQKEAIQQKVTPRGAWPCHTTLWRKRAVRSPTASSHCAPHCFRRHKSAYNARRRTPRREAGVRDDNAAAAPGTSVGHNAKGVVVMP